MTTKFVNSQADLKTVLELRRQVFVTEQGIPAELDADGKDPDSIHLMLLEQGELIASGRLTPQGNKGILSRIVVHPQWRKKGLGKKVVLLLEEKAKIENIPLLQLKPHEYLEKFYQDLGYQTIGREQEKVGDHVLLIMEKHLTT